ncbi:hypothetical protein K504DRAFT_498206 [Pleomassaria siparia CBS 279.74]|uniref:Uncharacterized protein n=1 Tax=Pleomassaria siparia CBS 279.74 TaxID=1314801 RepID=A0A6G1KKM5_9PLEO|nr:hypothetical protein K504DRAFT_498206 [Pleomassaria siparia CBS 279.74]
MPSPPRISALRSLSRSFTSTPFVRSALTKSPPRHSVDYSAYPKRAFGSAIRTLPALGFFFGVPIAAGMGMNKIGV